MIRGHNYSMKLQEVMIKGYKSISYNNPVSLKLGDVNILLGANGAGKGKSNIIGVFKMISFMMSRSFEMYVEMAGTANSLLYYGAKRTPAISAKLVFADSKSIIDTYRFTLSKAAPDRLIITEEDVFRHRVGEEKAYQVVLQPEFKESDLVGNKDMVAQSLW